ncbi:MAG: UDP-N-acetylmuramoyl-L-alanine--D-glutamate ligase [Acidimicrobiales bacterium]|nr:MAG: UDP-N-acetylmuramoyl-L-alanine--D-glutamate ligase [Acidimicrobiales bacterium]
MGRSGALVVGLARTGEAVVRHFAKLGLSVVAVDDHSHPALRQRAAALGVELVEAPTPSRLAELAQGVEVVVVSPGVPAHHPVFALDPGIPVMSEVELAARATTVPILAITGTNGKTTVTTLVTRMLAASGYRAVAAGNIGMPLVEAVATDAEVLVVEVSSFQLALTSTFRPQVATWLNVAEDHLDWHLGMDGYVAAKARIWANQGAGEVAVANAEDPVVTAAAWSAPARLVTFGLGVGDYRVHDQRLISPQGVVARVDELPRTMPHDLANALAAVATAGAGGASAEACREVLMDFGGLPHRVELVGRHGGVSWYDDSKATTPASVLAALGGLASVVLVAGGRNKGMDLSALRAGAGRIRSVVAIGEAAGEIEAAFAGLSPVVAAGSMDEAVALAAEAARPGDSVVLSPACTSFDWYGSYAERGDDFARAVRTALGPGVTSGHSLDGSSPSGAQERPKNGAVR